MPYFRDVFCDVLRLMNILRRYGVFVSALCFCGGAVSEEDRYRLWVDGNTDGRRDYEFKLMRLVLESSREAFGDFHFEVEDVHLPIRRVAERSIRQGDDSLITTTIHPDTRPYLKMFAHMENPLLNGMLGYRKLMINRENASDFQEMNEGKLKALRVGQVGDWIDTKIYRLNGFSVVPAIQFDSLFAMLKYHRYDYLPLGITEIDDIVAGVKEDFPELVVAPNIFLHYHLPVYLLYSSTNQTLKDRLEYGFQRLSESGQGASFFQEYYQAQLKEIEAKQAKVYDLKFVADF